MRVHVCRYVCGQVFNPCTTTAASTPITLVDGSQSVLNIPLPFPRFISVFVSVLCVVFRCAFCLFYFVCLCVMCSCVLCVASRVRACAMKWSSGVHRFCLPCPPPAGPTARNERARRADHRATSAANALCAFVCVIVLLLFLFFRFLLLACCFVIHVCCVYRLTAAVQSSRQASSTFPSTQHSGQRSTSPHRYLSFSCTCVVLCVVL